MPLEAVGHHGETSHKCVCKEVLARNNPGAKGSGAPESTLRSAAFRMPKDALSGAILTLLAAGNIVAQTCRRGPGPKELPFETQIGKSHVFYRDETAAEHGGSRLKVRRASDLRAARV